MWLPTTWNWNSNHSQEWKGKHGDQPPWKGMILARGRRWRTWLLYYLWSSVSNLWEKTMNWKNENLPVVQHQQPVGEKQWIGKWKPTCSPASATVGGNNELENEDVPAVQHQQPVERNEGLEAKTYHLSSLAKRRRKEMSEKVWGWRNNRQLML